MAKYTKEKRKSESLDRNKLRGVYRKDFTTALKRVRTDANVSVLQYFDEEETLFEQTEQLNIENKYSVSTDYDEDGTCSFEKVQLDNFFKNVPSCDRMFLGESSSFPSSSSIAHASGNILCDTENVLLTTQNGSNTNNNHSDSNTNSNSNITKTSQNGVHNNNEVEEGREHSINSDVNWDDVFQTANCLSVFNNFLQLQMPLKLDNFVHIVSKISQVSEACNVRTVLEEDVPNDFRIVCLRGVKEEVKEEVREVQMGNVKEELSGTEKVSSTETETPMEIDAEHSSESSAECSAIAISSNAVVAVETTTETPIQSVTEIEIPSDIPTFDLPSLLEAVADIDRIHLCLVNSLRADLHSLLDLGE